MRRRDHDWPGLLREATAAALLLLILWAAFVRR